MNKYIAGLVILIVAGVVAVTIYMKVESLNYEKAATAASGQTVHFNAWGGSDNANDYIAWVGKRLKEDHDITLVHVKLTDSADAVSRILAEKTAGRNEGGSVDLIWVNGENFATLKRNGLLRDDAWAFDLPSWRFTDAKALPALKTDFGNPTDGLESPWGRAQLIFAYDQSIVNTPPRSAEDLKTWIMENPGRFTFSQPPDFTGTSFLKQIAIELSPDRDVFASDAATVDTDAALAPLWEWLDAVTPSLWQKGRSYPKNSTNLTQLLGDGDIDIAMAFNPAHFSNHIESGVLPDTVRTYIHEEGTLANVHYVAIPFNAKSAEAAMITADFLLSPEAQIRKANTDIWGDPTVLSVAKLTKADQDAFNALPRGVATLTESELSKSLPEPHPSWVGVIEKGWESRYLSGN
jgi:putative thiamine transport system substrate-binding protein